jgi:chromosome segregation protein
VKIKSLTLQGFKSFPDRTTIAVHEGLTAVVGPNGCGKSNISDALRWVLGEQRPTAIRGARMEEAIFGGTESRRPIHRAEVTLALSNEDGLLPLPYSEVVVGRTVYRGGESEYTLNGTNCRLRDIHDLCRDTGLGANAYAVMEGRMIDSVLSDRAEERRALFEEAAEIGRYKDRRRTALRRLEQAEVDLQRLDDVLTEVQSKARSLAQQRGRADRHARLRARLLRLEVAVADETLAHTSARLAKAETELQKLRERSPGEEASLQTAETETETLRLAHGELERGRSDLARRHEEARQRLEQRERDRLVAEERATAAEGRVAALTDELRQIENRRVELERAVGDLQEERDELREAQTAVDEETTALRAEAERLGEGRDESRFEAEKAVEEAEGAALAIRLLEAELAAESERSASRAEEAARRREELSALDGSEKTLSEEVDAATAAAAAAESAGRDLGRRLAALHDELDGQRSTARSLREKVARLEGEISSARARTASLEGFVSSGAGLPSAVRELIEDADSIPGFVGVLAEFVEAPADLTAAVESHLGPYLHGVVVRDWKAVQRVREWAKKRTADASLILLPLDTGPRPSTGSAGKDGALYDRVEARGPARAWAEALLGAVSLESPEHFAPTDRSWVLPDGSGQDAWGAVRIGGSTSGKGILGSRAELDQQREVVTTGETELEAAKDALSKAERALMHATAEADEVERAARTTVLEHGEHERNRQDVEQRLTRLVAERTAIHDRLEEIERGGGAAPGCERTERLVELRLTAREAEKVAIDVRELAKQTDAEFEATRSAVQDLEIQRARKEADVATAEDRLRRTEESLAEVQGRASRLESERGQQGRILEDSLRTVRTGEEDLAELLEARRELEVQLREAEERLEKERAELAEREETLKTRRRTERELTERRHVLELEVIELQASQATVRERLEAEWDSPLSELRERVEALETGDPASWEEELDQVRRSLARLGPVNLLAEQEYEEEKERLGFLTEQRDDLERAREDLRDSIRRINRTAAEAFRTRFEEIRTNFHRTFQTLFEGGECDLWLEDPDEPLDSPIEISASPRGKRTQRIHLLSGGERALTALALLFAIYLTKPSPFCLMDEVDAPLDESNVLRFVRMLEQFKLETQFIVITHNPQTIEAADWIYGVTMQEPGVSSVVGVQLGAVPEQVA